MIFSSLTVFKTLNKAISPAFTGNLPIHQQHSAYSTFPIHHFLLCVTDADGGGGSPVSGLLGDADEASPKDTSADSTPTAGAAAPPSDDDSFCLFLGEESPSSTPTTTAPSSTAALAKVVTVKKEGTTASTTAAKAGGDVEVVLVQAPPPSKKPKNILLHGCFDVVVLEDGRVNVTSAHPMYPSSLGRKFGRRKMLP